MGRPEKATDLPAFRPGAGCPTTSTTFSGTPRAGLTTTATRPLGARLLAVAHAFDELTTAREYHVPLSPESARMAIAREAGRRFCPVAVNALVAARLERFELRWM